METLKEFIEQNVIISDGDILSCVTLGIVAFVAVDFMHMLMSAVLSWFKRY